MGLIFTVILAAAVMFLPVEAEAAETVVMEIPVSVMVEGSEPDWNAVYTLELVAQREDCPMPEGSRDGVYRLAVKGGSTGSVRLVGGKPGEYDYLLRQIPGKNPGCRYDDRQFRLQVTVSERSLSAMAYDPEGKPVTDILFQNRWAEPAWVTFSAWTTLDSGTPEEGQFTCVLLSEDGERIAEVGNQGRKAVFPPLRFAEEGVYRYMIKEKAEPGCGILHDRAVYTMTVSVRREGDYWAEISCYRNEKPWDGLPSFANYTDGSAPQTGDDIGLWLTVMVLSGLALVMICIKKKHLLIC